MNSAPAVPPTASAVGFLRSTWAYLRSHGVVAGVILLCCMVEVSFTTGLPMCFAHLVDKVLVGGDFTQYNGVAAGYLARLNADGSRDTGFTATANGCMLT